MSKTNINRNVAPAIHIAKHIHLPCTETFTLSNGLIVYGIKSEHEVVKIDFSFEAGKWYEPTNLVADFATRLAKEGTQTKSAFEIDDLLDFYGCNLEDHTFFSNAGFQLYSLKKNLDAILPLIKEIFTKASFTHNEFETLTEKRKAQHFQNLAKNDYLANRIFLQNMWGQAHPYGRVTEESDFEKLNIIEIKSYFFEYFNAQNCFIIISGNYTDTNISKLDSLFGQADWAGKKATKVMHSTSSNPILDHYQPIDGAVQSTVMVGQQSILKTHPDFDALSVLNTIFGGYFGSRLMTNIREEKGYTYGIYSSLTPYKNGTIFEVSADVGKEHREATFYEIKNEMQRLQHEMISKEELETVQNYLSGRILRSVDGAFRYADVWKGLLLFDKSADSVNSYLETIHSMTPKKVKYLAEQYLDFDNMYKVAVG